jgi:polar amino acid transport system substrate-binding protein
MLARKLTLTLFWILFSWSTLSTAASYTIGVENLNYYPLASIDEKKEYSGFARELFDAFAAKKGHKITYIPLPIPRLWDTFLNNKLDAKYPDHTYWNADIKKAKGLNITYSLPVVKFTEGLMVLPAKKGQGMDKIKKIATVRGFTPFPYLDAVQKGLVTVSEHSDLDAAIQMGLNERVDGVYVNVAVALAVLHKENNDGKLIYDSSLPKSDNNYFLSSISHPELIKDFNEFLITEKATVDKLKERFKAEEGLQ